MLEALVSQTELAVHIFPVSSDTLLPDSTYITAHAGATFTPWQVQSLFGISDADQVYIYYDVYSCNGGLDLSPGPMHTARREYQGS